MDMDKELMKKRPKQFALRIIKCTEVLPRSQTATVIGRQLLRSGTSVGANYRAACRAKSNADFIAKMGIVEEEADESAYWMELLVEANLVEATLLADFLNEANQLTAITVASIKTARQK